MANGGKLSFVAMDVILFYLVRMFGTKQIYNKRAKTQTIHNNFKVLHGVIGNFGVDDRLFNPLFAAVLQVSNS